MFGVGGVVAYWFVGPSSPSHDGGRQVTGGGGDLMVETRYPIVKGLGTLRDLGKTRLGEMQSNLLLGEEELGEDMESILEVVNPRL